MTTQVEIKNLGPHGIRVHRASNKYGAPREAVAEIPPGDKFTTSVWGVHDLSIEEVIA